MSVIWATTSPESGRFSPGEKCSDGRDLSARFNELRTRGQGYLEVRSPDSEFPVLTLGFRNDRAVVHRFQDAEKVSLLAGDGTVASDAAVEVLIMDELAEFTGDFVLGVDHAWALVREFIRTGMPNELGEWREL